jgi:hypothetical protein
MDICTKPRTHQRKEFHKKINPEIVKKLAPVLTTQEIAELQGVHRTTIMRYLKSHEIEATLADLEVDLPKELLLSAKQGLDLKHRIISGYVEMGREEWGALSNQTKIMLLSNVNTSY